MLELCLDTFSYDEPKSWQTIQHFVQNNVLFQFNQPT